MVRTEADIFIGGGLGGHCTYIMEVKLLKGMGALGCVLRSRLVPMYIAYLSIWNSHERD
jgi:hypothetical protein